MSTFFPAYPAEYPRWARASALIYEMLFEEPIGKNILF